MKRFFEKALASLAALALFLAGPAWAVNNPVKLYAAITPAGGVTTAAASGCAQGAVAVIIAATGSTHTSFATPTDTAGNTYSPVAAMVTTNQNTLVRAWYSVLSSAIVSGATTATIEASDNSGVHASWVCVPDARALGSVAGQNSVSATGSVPDTGNITNTQQPEWVLVGLHTQSGMPFTLTGLSLVTGSNDATGFGVDWNYVRTTLNQTTHYTSGTSEIAWATFSVSFTEVASGGGGTTTAACPNQLLLGEC